MSKSPKLIGRYQAVKAQGGVLSTLLQENAEFVQSQENVAFIENVEQLLVGKQENIGLFKDEEGNN